MRYAHLFLLTLLACGSGGSTTSSSSSSSSSSSGELPTPITLLDGTWDVMGLDLRIPKDGLTVNIASGKMTSQGPGRDGRTIDGCNFSSTIKLDVSFNASSIAGSLNEELTYTNCGKVGQTETIALRTFKGDKTKGSTTTLDGEWKLVVGGLDSSKISDPSRTLQQGVFTFVIDGTSLDGKAISADGSQYKISRVGDKVTGLGAGPEFEAERR